MIENLRFRGADLDDRPMPREGERGGLVGPRSAEDEVVVAVNQDADHFLGALHWQAGDGVTQARWYTIRYLLPGIGSIHIPGQS